MPTKIKPFFFYYRQNSVYIIYIRVVRASCVLRRYIVSTMSVLVVPKTLNLCQYPNICECADGVDEECPIRGVNSSTRKRDLECDCVAGVFFSPGGLLDSGGRVARKRVLQRSFEFSGEVGWPHDTCTLLWLLVILLQIIAAVTIVQSSYNRPDARGKNARNLGGLKPHPQHSHTPGLAFG